VGFCSTPISMKPCTCSDSTVQMVGVAADREDGPALLPASSAVPLPEQALNTTGRLGTPRPQVQTSGHAHCQLRNRAGTLCLRSNTPPKPGKNIVADPPGRQSWLADAQMSVELSEDVDFRQGALHIETKTMSYVLLVVVSPVKSSLTQHILVSDPDDDGGKTGSDPMVSMLHNKLRQLSKVHRCNCRFPAEQCSTYDSVLIKGCRLASNSDVSKSTDENPTQSTARWRCCPDNATLIRTYSATAYIQPSCNVAGRKYMSVSAVLLDAPVCDLR
jgi:hypothetical protein